MNNINNGQEHPMKQVRFASSSPAVLSNSEPSDSSNCPVNQDSIGPQLKLLPLNDQIRELQTIIRDKWVHTGVLGDTTHLLYNLQSLGYEDIRLFLYSCVDFAAPIKCTSALMQHH